MKDGRIRGSEVQIICRSDIAQASNTSKNQASKCTSHLGSFVVFYLGWAYCILPSNPKGLEVHSLFQIPAPSADQLCAQVK